MFNKLVSVHIKMILIESRLNVWHWILDGKGKLFQLLDKSSLLTDDDQIDMRLRGFDLEMVWGIHFSNDEILYSRKKKKKYMENIHHYYMFRMAQWTTLGLKQQYKALYFYCLYINNSWIELKTTCAYSSVASRLTLGLKKREFFPQKKSYSMKFKIWVSGIMSLVSQCLTLPL